MKAEHVEIKPATKKRALHPITVIATSEDGERTATFGCKTSLQAIQLRDLLLSTGIVLLTVRGMSGLTKREFAAQLIDQLAEMQRPKVHVRPRRIPIKENNG